VKLILFLSLVSAAALWAQEEGPAPLEPEEQKKLIADVKARALQYAKDLPSFSCTEVTRKNLDPTGTSRHWKLTGTVHEEVTEKNGKDSFVELTENGKQAGGENRPGGMTSPADFTDLIAWIFDPESKAEFEWTKWDSMRGHRVHTLAFKLPQANSHFTVGKKSPVKIAVVGTVDVDADTDSIMRIIVLGLGIPKSTGVQSVSQEYHYDFAKIGDHYFLVPLKADLQQRAGKELTWNEIEFRDYKKPQ